MNGAAHRLPDRHQRHVSVPLRGKDSHELEQGYVVIRFNVGAVSVPLRGKDSHEHRIEFTPWDQLDWCFRPLAGKR